MSDSQQVNFCNHLIINKISPKLLSKSLALSDIFRTFAPVNRKVTDISETLLAMTEEMRLKRETIDSQHAEICRLSRLVESLHVELHKRDKRIEELEAKLAKYEAPTRTQATAAPLPRRRT